MSHPTSTSSAAALSARTSTAPRRIIDNPRELDDDTLRDIIVGAGRRNLVLGTVTGAAAIAITGLLAPVTAIGAFAAVPAYLGGWWLSTSLARRAAAAELGVTPQCLRAVELAIDRADLRRDLRTLRGRELFVRDVEVAVRNTRAELERSRG